MNIDEFPRPPILEAWDGETLTVMVKDGDSAEDIIVQTSEAIVYKEKGRMPNFYFAPEDIEEKWAKFIGTNATKTSVCEWKGDADYLDLAGYEGMNKVESIGWVYKEPKDEFEHIAGWYSFYPQKVDCYIGSRKVDPEDIEGFYGGWVYDDVVTDSGREPGTVAGELAGKIRDAIGNGDLQGHRIFFVVSPPDTTEANQVGGLRGYDQTPEEMTKLAADVIFGLEGITKECGVFIQARQYGMIDVKVAHGLSGLMAMLAGGEGEDFTMG